MDNKGKTIAIISYLTLVGFIVALVMNNTTKSKFATFHLRQSFGVLVMTVGASLLRSIGVFGFGMVGRLLFIVVMVFYVLGIVSAIQNEEKPLPVFGSYFQEWFTFIN